MGRCDSNWIIILCFIHFDACGVEKVEKSANGTQFGKMGFETFRKRFEVSNLIFFVVKCYQFGVTPFIIYTYISNVVISMPIGVRMQKLCHLEVDIPIFTPIGHEDATTTPIIHGKRASHVIMM